MTATVFSDVTRDYIGRAGIPARDLLPIIPVGAALSEGSRIDPKKQLGKIPGKFNKYSGKWSGLAGEKITFGMSKQDVDAAKLWPTQNVGLRAENFPAIDCDVETKEARDLVEGLVFRYLGDAPVRERGNAARVLFVFRRSGDELIRKTRLMFKDNDGVEHAVEVLGAGQQYVINGTHPSSAIYEWQPGKELVSKHASNLTPVTVDSILGFMEELEGAIHAKGWEVTHSHRPKYVRNGDGRGVEVYTADPLVTKEVALKALRSMKNDVEQFPERDDILRLMAGFKHALGREADSAYPDFEEWATAHDFKNADEFKHMWDSLRVVHVPADYLFSKARERGFSTAALDFADFKMSEEDFAAGRRQQQEEEDAYQEVANRLLYIAESGTWIVKGTGEMLTHSALNTYPGLGTALAPAGASGQKTAANMLINRGGVGLVRGAVYLAGKGETVKWTKDGRGGEFFNLWHATYHDLPASVTDEQVQPWLEHVAYIIPNQEEREHFLNYLAYIVQNRGVKVRYAPIIVGGQGTGKDLMLRPLSQFFDHNYVEIGPEALADKFNGYLERELVVVNEMMRFDKQSTYDRIKVLISGSSSDSLRVEKKFKDAYDVPNNVNLIFFSNHADAVSLEGDDRRFFVITSDAVRKDDEYYDRLADDFYKYQSGWRAVIRWLMQRDVQEFKPDARPMETDGKREMIDASRPAFLSTIIKELDGFHKQRTVLTSRELFDTVVSDYNYPMPQPMRQKVASVSKVSDALKAAGWANGKKMVRLVAGENPTRVWTRDPEMLNWSDDRLRAQYLTEIKKVA